MKQASSAASEVVERIDDFRARQRSTSDRLFDEVAQREDVAGRVYLHGAWVDRRLLGKVAAWMNRHQLVQFLEFHVLLALGLLFGAGFFKLFAFLFMP